jgi:hypothetical protein
MSASLASVRAQLDEDIFAAVWVKGEMLSLEQAVTYVLEHTAELI